MRRVDTHAMPENDSEIALQRFRAMGISARIMQDQRCVLASMPLGKAPFAGAPPQRFDAVLFATVGVDQIKCLRPRALFQLPILSIQGCRQASAIEARIRGAWEKHAAEIARTRDWLSVIGTEATLTDGSSTLSLRIEGEEPCARATMIDRHHVVLPSRGRLTGVCLRGPEQRVMEIARDITSGLSLDIAISARLEELSHGAARAYEDRRHQALSVASGIVTSSRDANEAQHILVVGTRLTAEHDTIASLRLRGYNVTTAANQQEAITFFGRVSPHLVLADVDLGRTDGIELIVALRALPGVEDLPVILVDDRSRPARREAARQVGAVGYIVYPMDVSRIAKHLSSIIASPRQRRFTRYSSTLPVQIAGQQQTLLASALGRGGMYVSTREPLELNAVHRYRLSLPDIGQTLHVDAKVIYTAASFRDHGAGLRFRDFPGENESLLIQYLRSLEKARAD